jgi:ATP-dependent Clp protease ATP-binding subunit ClpC
VFDRYTERARIVAVVAQEKARSLNHNYIGSEHILLGILVDDDCLATRALTSLGATYENTKPVVVKQCRYWRRTLRWSIWSTAFCAWC